MAASHRTINVRLPAALADKFALLAAEIPGLPQSVLLRMILEDYLDQDMSEQIAGILARLTKQGKGKRHTSQAQRTDNRESNNRLTFARNSRKPG